MHLYELCKQLEPTSMDVGQLPDFILGCFRRKSITFCNGLTDEKTIVYWFQSLSFTIDLRLSEASDTPVSQRQGWIADTIWDKENQLLSWQPLSGYQVHTQWPEPARLYVMGNSILEFSPNHSYVEDWRQQSAMGRYLGLKLLYAQHIASGNNVELTGGIIVCGENIAYVQSRLPHVQQQLENYLVQNHLDTITQMTELQTLQISTEIEAYETSVSLGKDIIDYTTQNEKQGTAVDLAGFELIDNTIVQYKTIQGECYRLYYSLDVWQPNHLFSYQSAIHPDTQDWFGLENQHLFYHAKPVY